MTKNIHFIILLILFSFSQVKSLDNNILSQNPKSDSIIRQVFLDYQTVFTTTKDEKSLEKIFVSETEWKELVVFATQRQPNCISLDESEFDYKVNFKIFKELVDSKKINIKQLYVNKIEYNNSCGNLFIIPRVTCTVQYNDNKVVEVPFLLIKTMNNEYKIIRNFLNYKIFPNE